MCHIPLLKTGKCCERTLRIPVPATRQCLSTSSVTREEKNSRGGIVSIYRLRRYGPLVFQENGRRYRSSASNDRRLLSHTNKNTPTSTIVIEKQLLCDAMTQLCTKVKLQHDEQKICIPALQTELSSLSETTSKAV